MTAQKVDRVAALLVDLRKDRAALASKSQPLRDKRSKLLDEISKIEVETRKLTAQIREIEADELVKLDKQIGALTRAIPTTKSLTAESQK